MKTPIANDSKVLRRRNSYSRFQKRAELYAVSIETSSEAWHGACALAPVATSDALTRKMVDLHQSRAKLCADAPRHARCHLGCFAAAAAAAVRVHACTRLSWVDVIFLPKETSECDNCNHCDLVSD